MLLLGYDKDGKPVYCPIPKGWYPHTNYTGNPVYKAAYNRLVKLETKKIK